VLLTRAPLYSGYCYPFLVRLACVRHAASVDSEPGSNSRLKPDVVPSRRRSDRVDRSRTHHLATEVQGTLLVRMIKPNLIYSHNWHVQPSFQRSVRALRLSGTLWDRGPGCDAKVSSNLLRSTEFALTEPLRRFLRELAKPIELFALCQTFFFVSSEAVRTRCRRWFLDAMNRKDDRQVTPNQHLSRCANLSNSDQHRSSR
jgi:hypothetical protein